MTHTCPYCKGESERPLYFSLAVQRVVNFILDNPWCSAFDIERGVYGRTTGTNVVSTRLYLIRKAFKSTPWRLKSRQHPIHGHQRQYSIVKINLQKATNDVNVQSPNSLP